MDGRIAIGLDAGEPAAGCLGAVVGVARVATGGGELGAEVLGVTARPTSEVA